MLDDRTKPIRAQLGFLEEPPLPLAKRLDCPFSFSCPLLIHTRFLVCLSSFWKGSLSFRGRLRESNLPSRDCCGITNTVADACQMVTVVLRASDMIVSDHSLNLYSGQYIQIWLILWFYYSRRLDVKVNCSSFRHYCKYRWRLGEIIPVNSKGFTLHSRLVWDF